MRNIFNSEKEFAKKNIPVKFNHGGELNKGIEIEMEHANTLKNLFKHKINPNKAVEEIAKEHIKEDPSYYSKLNKMEHKFAGGGNIEIGQRGEYGRKKILGTIKKISPKIVTFTEEATGKDKTYYVDDFKKGFVLLTGSSGSTTTTQQSAPKTTNKKQKVLLRTQYNDIQILEPNNTNGFIVLTNNSKQNAFEFLSTVIQRMGYVRDNGSTDVLSDTDSPGFYCFKRVSDDKLIVEPLTQSKVNNASAVAKFDIANIFYWEQQKSLCYLPAGTDRDDMFRIVNIGNRVLTEDDFRILPIGTKIAKPKLKNGSVDVAIARYNYLKENLNNNKDFDFFYYQGPYQGFYDDVMLSFENKSGGGDLYTIGKDELKLYIDDSQTGIDISKISKPITYDELKAYGIGTKIKIPANNGNISRDIVDRNKTLKLTTKFWAEAIKVNESEIEWAEIVEFDDSDRTIKIDRFDGNKNPISYMYIWPDNVDVYLYYEDKKEQEVNKTFIPLSNIPSTDSSTWDANYNVGDIVSIRKDFCDPKYEVDFDYNSEANIGVIKSVKSISTARRKENPGGFIYEVNFPKTSVIQSWEPKDLELRLKGDSSNVSSTTIDKSSSNKNKKAKKESKKTKIKKANNIEEAINNWVKNNSVNLVKKEWGEDAKNMLLEFIK